jgi:hypothetical protein
LYAPKGYCRNIKDKYSCVCQPEIHAGVIMKAHFIKFLGCNSGVCQFLNKYKLLNKNNFINLFILTQLIIFFVFYSLVYNIYKYAVFKYCIIPLIPVSVDIILWKTSYLHLQNTVMYKTWNSVLLTHTHICTKHLKIHLDLTHDNASYCSECRASFCMEECKKHMYSESVTKYISRYLKGLQKMPHNIKILA